MLCSVYRRTFLHQMRLKLVGNFNRIAEVNSPIKIHPSDFVASPLQLQLTVIRWLYTYYVVSPPNPINITTGLLSLHYTNICLISKKLKLNSKQCILCHDFTKQKYFYYNPASKVSGRSQHYVKRNINWCLSF